MFCENISLVIKVIRGARIENQPTQHNVTAMGYVIRILIRSIANAKSTSVESFVDVPIDLQ